MILLHHCCVVCSPKVLEILRQEFKAVTGLWYNPNIMPEDEYNKRLNAMKVYSKEQKHRLIIEDEIGSAAPHNDTRIEIGSAAPHNDKLDKTGKTAESRTPGSNWWIENVKKIESAGGDRCEFCYYVRLKRAARTAKEKGFKKFTTTLLSSRYQKHELIKSMGELAAKEDGVEFYYKDYRPFFYEGKNEVYKRGLYMQKYCGCIFS